ncbi:MAG: UDP-N-acetylmuramoyl-tripeptide--D-alanyl-D-alanine ligase [Kiritimatiellae bacterium]|nr:UDP-N-acetylmuramoyl-tripeptide--D-alanyl-D-alanine ligase [Kiritimatiellia bacterium]MDD4735198.1 UDP-N-acetylmuramoyl-tripeptide--D-alanyl-D-alanine ligase [Kiritimatiellia bacterium]
MTWTSDNLARWCAGDWCGAAPVADFTGVFHDTREAFSGGLYVAIKGDRLDGHAFVKKAFESGAAAAVVSREYAVQCPDFPGALFCVDDTRRALMELAAGYRKNLRGLIIGLTGSVGKTTVKEMLADVLACAGRVARTRGNRNNELGLPLSLLSMSPEDEYGVFEAGINHPGEMAMLARVLQPDWGVMTLVGAAHIGFFESEEQIACEKAELFRALPEEGTAVLDVDQRWAETILQGLSCRRLTVSSSGRSDADYSLVDSGEAQILRLVDRVHNRTWACRMPLPGRHMMQDALLALAVGLSLGVEPESACRAIASFKPVAMRWQVEHVEGVCFVNDAYNANPLSMRAALATFAELRGYGAKWLVLGGMGELGGAERSEHEGLGAALADGPWERLVTVGTMGAGIAEGAVHAGMPSNRIHRCADVREAARLLRECRLAEKDAVLLKASRFAKLEDVLSLFKEQSTLNPKG